MPGISVHLLKMADTRTFRPVQAAQRFLRAGLLAFNAHLPSRQAAPAPPKGRMFYDVYGFCFRACDFSYGASYNGIRTASVLLRETENQNANHRFCLIKNAMNNTFLLL